MVNLYLQDFGTVCKLFIFADTQQEAEYQCNSLFNWKGTSGEVYPLDVHNGKFRYFIWSSKRKLIKYFYNIIEHKYFLRTGREPDGLLFKAELLKQAERAYKNLERQEVMSRKTLFSINTNCYIHHPPDKLYKSQYNISS